MKRIHVNQHKIRANIHAENPEPPVAIKEGRSNTYCNEAEFLDREGNVLGRIKYSAHKPLLSCGARLIIEWESGMRIVS